MSVLSVRQHQRGGTKAASNPPANPSKAYVSVLVKLVPSAPIGGSEGASKSAASAPTSLYVANGPRTGSSPLADAVMPFARSFPSDVADRALAELEGS